MRPTTGESFTVQSIEKQGGPRPWVLEQLEANIRHMQSLQHEHVLGVHEWIDSEGFAFLMTGGADARELLEYYAEKHPEKALPEDWARAVFQQLILALDYCSKRGFAHGSLSPASLWVTKRGIVKVRDFGMSGFQMPCDPGTLATLPYRALEARGASDQPYNAFHADIWSAGAVLYRLLAGRAPPPPPPPTDADGGQEDPRGRLFPGDGEMAGRFSHAAQDLIAKMLVLRPKSRCHIADVIGHAWFQIGFAGTDAAAVACAAPTLSTSTDTQTATWSSDTQTATWGTDMQTATWSCSAGWPPGSASDLSETTVDLSVTPLGAAGLRLVGLRAGHQHGRGRSRAHDVTEEHELSSTYDMSMECSSQPDFLLDTKSSIKSEHRRRRSHAHDAPAGQELSSTYDMSMEGSSQPDFLLDAKSSIKSEHREDVDLELSDLSMHRWCPLPLSPTPSSAASKSLPPSSGADQRDGPGAADAEYCLSTEMERQLQVLRGFLLSREKMRILAEQMVPPTCLDPLLPGPPDAAAVRQSVQEFDQMWASATRARPQFMDCVRAVVARAGLDPAAVATHDGAPLAQDATAHYTRLTEGPPESVERALGKINDEYGGDAARLVDAVRCSVVVDTAAQLAAVARALRDGAAVVGARNRFADPPWDGYRDALCHVRVDGHVCAVQLHLGAILQHRLETRRCSEHFRRYFACDADARRTRMALLERLDGGGGAEGAIRALLKSEAAPALEDLWALALAAGDCGLLQRVARRLLELQPASLRHMCRAAGALRLGGRADDALGALKRCLAHCGAILPGNPRMTLVDLKSVGDVLRGQGALDHAGAVYREAYEQARATAGERHLETLTSLKGLASVRRGQGRHVEAELLHRECTARWSTALGDDHPVTLKSLNDVALALCDRNRFAEGAALHRQCLDRRRAVLGEHHPDVLNSLSNIALACDRQGDGPRAEGFYRQCLAGWVVAGGASHPRSQTALKNLAMFLLRQGRGDEAEALLTLDSVDVGGESSGPPAATSPHQSPLFPCPRVASPSPVSSSRSPRQS